MRLAFFTAACMCAFAANSLLNREAVEAGHISAVDFALVRVVSGAAALALIVVLTRRGFGRPTPAGALGLALYMAGFSLAYARIQAGPGALILFGAVQVILLSHAAWLGRGPALWQLGGAGVAFAGLALALWPAGAGAIDPLGAMLMLGAASGWALYTVAGRGAADPLAATATNFACAALALSPLLLVAGGEADAAGVALAVTSGAVTSGLGYALWYSVLPRIEPVSAAVVQLSVPVLALAAGVALLDEALSARVLVAAALVVGGIAFALLRGLRPVRGRT